MRLVTHRKTGHRYAVVAHVLDCSADVELPDRVVYVRVENAKTYLIALLLRGLIRWLHRRVAPRVFVRDAEEFGVKFNG